MFLLAPPCRAADPAVRVGLYAQLRLPALEAELQKDPPARVLIKAEGGEVVFSGDRKAGPAGELQLGANSSGVCLKGAGAPRRCYKGKLLFSAAGGRLRVVNETALEDYVAGVTAGEARDLKNLEAYKAQAVAARTYALSHLRNHRKEGYQLCDLPHCQYYNGAAAPGSMAAAAAAATRGELLYYRGAPASAYYHSACGGRTEDMANVWPFESKPYLRPVQDGPPGAPYCAGAPCFRWRAKIYFTGLTRLALAAGWLRPGEEARGLAVSDKGRSGRAEQLEIYTRTRRVPVSATAFYHGIGRRAGWNAVRSSQFSIKQGRDHVLLEGRGSGHGVGLCQWGADGMAARGFNYRDILEHYYPGTELKK